MKYGLADERRPEMYNYSKQERAKSILQLLKRLSEKYEGDEAKAAGELDEELGPMWREEVAAAGLSDQLPQKSVKDGRPKEIEAFYKKIRNKLKKEGENMDQVPDKGRVPMEPCDIASKLKKAKSKSERKRLSIMMGVKLDQ